MERKFHVRNIGEVHYSIGQPMGFISSWSTFSLAHHILIRTAFEKVGENPIYWMLGDDVVIGSVRAKEVYLDMMTCLGVEISMGKSVISDDGSSFEFAKRFVSNYKDISAVS